MSTFGRKKKAVAIVSPVPTKGTERPPLFASSLSNSTPLASVRTDQSTGLLRGQVTGSLGADLALEEADGLTAQSTEDAVHGPFVVTQVAQRLLDPPPVCFRHIGLVGHVRRRRG